jgi:hypothetical protein
VTLPQGRNELRARRMAVWWTFREPSLGTTCAVNECATRSSISPLIYPQLLATKAMTSKDTVLRIDTLYRKLLENQWKKV